MTSRDAPGWSLASRLTAWYSISAFVLLLGLSIVLDWALSSNLEAETATLADRERTELVNIFHQKPHDFREVREEIERDADESAETRVWVRVIDLTGKHPTVETGGMVESGLGESLESPDDAREPWIAGARLVLPSGLHVRAFSDTENVSGDVRYRIQIFVDATRLERIEARYRQRAALLLLIAFSGFSLVGYAIARRGLAPLTRIASTMEDIRSTTMDQRVDLTDLSRELWIVAAAFNDVLDRLDDAFERLERSAADIAHELRTPLTRIRLAAEVALHSTTDLEQGKEALRNCLEEASELTQLIDRVLFLARTDERLASEHGDLIDVDSELRQVTEFYEAPASDRGIALSTHAAPSIVVRGDRGLLLRAVSNLIENAMRHTPSGGSISLLAAQNDGSVAISVCDTGCGIPGEHLETVFDPFTRVDGARSSESGGAGLGLAIVKKIVSIHGGEITIASRVGSGTTVTMTLPAAPV